MKTKCLKNVRNSTISSLFAGIVVIMAMFLSVACEKNETSVADQQQTVRKPQPISDMEIMQYLPEVVDGRLVFKDRETFNKYRQWIFENQGTPEKLFEINRTLGFISMREIYEEGLESLLECNESSNDFVVSHRTVFHASEVDGSIIQDLQAPNLLSYITNEFGVYQIGDRIIRVAYNYYYVISNCNVNLLAVIIDAKRDEVACDKIAVYSTEREEKTQFNYRTAYFSNANKRIVARLHRTLTDGDYEYEAETNSQQKILTAWLGRQLSGVWVYWPTGYYIYNSTYYPSESGGTYGGATYQTIKETFCLIPESHYTSPLIDLNSSYMQTDHYGKDGTEEKRIEYSNSFLGEY